MIRLALPDTPAMRRLLDQLAGHVHDDVIPFYEDDEPNPAAVAAAEAFIAAELHAVHGHGRVRVRR